MCLQLYYTRDVFADQRPCFLGGARTSPPSSPLCLSDDPSLRTLQVVIDGGTPCYKPLVSRRSSIRLVILKALPPTRRNLDAARNGQLIRIVCSLQRVSPRLAPLCYNDAIPNLCCSRTFTSLTRRDLPGHGNWTVSGYQHNPVL